MNIQIDFLNKEITPTYGGSTVLLTYAMKTRGHNVRENNYTITAEVRGIETLDLHFNVISVEALNNNEDTLIDVVVEDIFYNKVSSY